MILFEYLREPLWLWLIPIPMLFGLLAWRLRRRQGQSYAEPALFDWVIDSHQQQQQHPLLRYLVLQLAWLMLAIALAGPRVPEKIANPQPEHYQELVVLLDLSLSMTASDISPSRLERARLELLDLVDQLQDTRLALLVFSQHAHVISPLTADRNALRFYIQQIQPGLLPTEGSNLPRAILEASRSFSTQTQVARSLLVISDGEHHLPETEWQAALSSLATQLQQQSIVLYTLGAGSEQGAAVLNNDARWLEYDGSPVISTRNDTALRQLAALNQGSYSVFSDDNSDWDALYEQGVRQQRRYSSAEGKQQQILWHERFTAFAIASLLLFLIGLLPWRRPAQTGAATLPIVLLCLVASLPLPETAQAAEQDLTALRQQAWQAYREGQVEQACDRFARLPGYDARLALGVIRYQQGQYAQANQAFMQAVLAAESDTQRIEAIFNLANSHYQLTDYMAAKQLYADVLRYAPQHRAATINLGSATDLLIAQQREAVLNKKRRRLVTREGRGPDMADAVTGIEVRGKVSLGNERPNDPVPLTDQAQLDDISNPPGDALNSSPASTRVERRDDASWSYNITRPDQITQREQTIHTNEGILWRRRFEVEEGFAAAQEKPNVLPGTRPW